MGFWLSPRDRNIRRSSASSCSKGYGRRPRTLAPGLRHRPCLAGGTMGNRLPIAGLAAVLATAALAGPVTARGAKARIQTLEYVGGGAAADPAPKAAHPPSDQHRR